MRLIKLGSKTGARKYMIVDDDVFENLKGIAISHARGYPRFSFWDKETKKLSSYQLHRIIVGAIEGEIVDHINGNELDNRRCNLRICTPIENTRNQRHGPIRARKAALSIPRGVYLEPSGKWRARAAVGPVQPNGRSKMIHLGLFNTMGEANAAYVSATKQAFGAFYRIEAVMRKGEG